MKRLIVADKTGRTIAIGPHPDDYPAANWTLGFAPLKGQNIHEVQLPAHVNSLEHVRELHKTHRVKVEARVAKLVKRR